VIFQKTPLEGAWVLELEHREDDRGFFARTYCANEFREHGLEPTVAQCNLSYNHRAGTMRGMHYQVPPATETKLVRATRGGIYDVIIDLRARNFEPYKVFATALTAAMKRLGDLHEVRNLVLLGTAIPESFAQIAKGSDEVPRHDWLFFKELFMAMPSGMRRPIYGDHTIVHPEFTAMDMRKVRAAGKIIYTTPKTWATRKGGAFRDNPAQMHAHCKEVVSDPAFAFRGAGFSYGDKYIADCAVKAESPSNLSRWKDVAINHHITTVAHDLANLFGTP